MKPSATAWRSTPAGEAAYRAAREDAQAKANASGMDHGIEANDLFKSYRVFLLPRVGNRYGHELRCEVVSSERDREQQPGHGHRADRPANGWQA